MCLRPSQDLVSALAGPKLEGCPAEGADGAGTAALLPEAAAGGPGPVEGTPSGLRQEEGEAGGSSTSFPTRLGCLGQETASWRGKVFPEALPAASVDGGDRGPVGARLPFWLVSEGWGSNLRSLFPGWTVALQRTHSI